MSRLGVCAAMNHLHILSGRVGACGTVCHSAFVLLTSCVCNAACALSVCMLCISHGLLRHCSAERNLCRAQINSMEPSMDTKTKLIKSTSPEGVNWQTKMTLLEILLDQMWHRPHSQRHLLLATKSGLYGSLTQMRCIYMYIPHHLQHSTI